MAPANYYIRWREEGTVRTDSCRTDEQRGIWVSFYCLNCSLGQCPAAYCCENGSEHAKFEKKCPLVLLNTYYLPGKTCYQYIVCCSGLPEECFLILCFPCLRVHCICSEPFISLSICSAFPPLFYCSNPLFPERSYVITKCWNSSWVSF